LIKYFKLLELERKQLRRLHLPSPAYDLLFRISPLGKQLLEIAFAYLDEPAGARGKSTEEASRWDLIGGSVK
jgi:hypothetical protein